MNTKSLCFLALLAGIGVVLHTVMPSFFGIKPDMMLAMMFLGIILIPEFKSVMLLSIVTGVLSALTTNFPGGQIPNIIDKLITAIVFYSLFLALNKFRNSVISAAVLTAAGTLVSGSVFLTAAYFIAGLPSSFTTLFAAGVLPAMAINALTIVILYPIANSIFKRTKLSQATVIQK